MGTPAGVAQSGTRAPALPLAMFSENASIYQPRSRFAQEAAAPALPAPGEAAGIDVRVSAEKNSGAAQTDARVQSEQQKGASAPAVLTRQSWPGLVKDGQQPIEAPRGTSFSRFWGCCDELRKPDSPAPEQCDDGCMQHYMHAPCSISGQWRSHAILCVDT